LFLLPTARSRLLLYELHSPLYRLRYRDSFSGRYIRECS
jgi:hypothetical protein